MGSEYCNDNDESEFRNRMQAKFEMSRWYVFILSLMVIPNVTFSLLRIITLQKEPPYSVRCLIPQLERTSWNFGEIQRISQPNVPGENCSYYNYNYNKMSEMDFEDALAFVELNPLPKIIRCGQLVFSHTSEYETIYKNFRLFCSKGLENAVIIISNFGSCLGYILVTILCDTLGRKVALTFGFTLLTISILLMNFSSVVEIYLMGRFTAGFAYAMVKCPLEVLAIEFSSVEFRPIAFFILNAGSDAVAFTVIPILLNTFKNWRYLQWSCTVGILFFPLIKWYIPESPRWLYSIKQKRKAWKVLKHLKNPSKQNDHYMTFQNDMKFTYERWAKHANDLSAFTGKRFWFSVIVSSITGASALRNYAENYEERYLKHRQIYLYLRASCDFLGLLFCSFMVTILGRKYSVLVSEVVVVLSASLLTHHGWEEVFYYYILEVSSTSANLVSELQTIENVPSTHRCTILGLLGACKSVLVILLFMLLQYFGITMHLLAIGMLGIVSLSFLYFTLADNAGVLKDTVDDLKLTLTSK